MAIMRRKSYDRSKDLDPYGGEQRIFLNRVSDSADELEYEGSFIFAGYQSFTLLLGYQSYTNEDTNNGEYDSMISPNTFNLFL